MVERAHTDHGVGDKDVCLKCSSRLADDKYAFTSATRKIATLTAVCCVLCALTISTCGCSLYLYTRFQCFRQELVALVKMNLDDADDTFSEYFEMEYNAMPLYGEQSDGDDQRTEHGVTNGIRHRRKKEKKGRKKDKGKCRTKQMRMCRCCQQQWKEYIDEKIQQETHPTQRATATPKPGTTHPTHRATATAKPVSALEQPDIAQILIAHYTTYIDEHYINTNFGQVDHGFKQKPKMHLHIPLWHGTLYRNRTFVTNEAPLSLRFFKEVNWTANPTTEKVFDYDEATGKFIARHTGLYHLHAHVTFYNVTTRMSIGLLHERRKGMPHDSNIVFRCVESVNHVDRQLRVGYNSKYKSCSVNGVLYLEAGDVVAIQSLYKNTCLDLSSDATYFGAIFFPI